MLHTAAAATTRRHLFIDGAWREPLGTGRFDVVDPSTEEVIGRVPRGDARDAVAAVQAASRALAGWSASSIAERRAFIERLAAAMLERAEDFAVTMMREVGSPIAMSREAQVGWSLGVVRSYLDVLDAFEPVARVQSTLVAQEAAGVVVAITPWNFPLLMIVQKVVPAIAAGCTVVLKPSEVTPLNAFLFADAVMAAGLPAGVFNLVCGDGPTVGEAMAAHPDVAVVSLTGSTRAGRRVGALAAEGIKRVSLELGGKSANLILPDADLERAVASGVGSFCFNSGQSCSSWSRMLVPREHYGDAVALVTAQVAAQRVGPPDEDGVHLGPLVSAAARDRVRGHIELGLREGARLVAGGSAAPEGLDVGYYVSPTVFADVDNGMRVAQEEIFGPVLAVIPYDGEDEGIAIANDSPYGLHGAVWAGDVERAVTVARRIDTGMVSINGGTLSLMAPWGGTKQSGIGREFGSYGLHEFLEPKTLQLPEIGS